MSARTSGSQLTGIRPDLSAAVRMTKEEGPRKHSPGFNLGLDLNPMVRPERAQELSNMYRSSALTGLSRRGRNSPKLKPGPIADQLTTTESILHYFPRAPISTAELRNVGSNEAT